MDSYETLFRIAKLLLAEEDDETTPERLLERVVEQTGAERAFIVVRDEEGNYVQKFAIAYDRVLVRPHVTNFELMETQ